MKDVTHGIIAECSAQVVAEACCSTENTMNDYHAQTKASMTVRESSSDGDREGCTVVQYGELITEKVNVDGVLKSGTLR